LIYCEKKGQLSLLKAARFMERYDMGIVTGEGFSTVAARALIQTAQKGQKYQIFVLHDADHSGYNIARTLREETARMPGYSVEVHDLGLTAEQALEKGMEPEVFTRSPALPKGLEPTLAEGSVEREWFVGEHSSEKKYKCKRVELDDMTAPEAVEHIETQLREKGVRPKVIPPDDKLPKMADEKYRNLSATWVSETIDELISAEEIKKEIADEFLPRFGLGGARGCIEERFDKNRVLSWRKALEASLEEVREQHEDEFKAAVEKKLRERLGSS
jgi:hypothetical protein